MRCKLTGREGKPSRSHIIPQAFYLISKSAKEPHRILSSNGNTHPKKCPVGIYDETIVTADGEGYFLKWDDYASKILLHNSKLLEPVRNPKDRQILGYQIAKYDYHKLKMFFISLLWRAGVSSRPEFGQINLGSHEAPLRRLILNDDPASTDDYAVVLALFHDVNDYATIISPFPERYDGIKCYRFYIGNIIAYIKVDQQRYRDPFDSMQMSPEKPLFFCARDFYGSKESKLFWHAVKRQVR